MTRPVNGHAVPKPGDHKGRPYSGQCWRTPLVRPLVRPRGVVAGTTPSMTPE